jgi:hypothetical protein
MNSQEILVAVALAIVVGSVFELIRRTAAKSSRWIAHLEIRHDVSSVEGPKAKDEPQ